jgi:photosystem I subunit 2
MTATALSGQLPKYHRQHRRSAQLRRNRGEVRHHLDQLQGPGFELPTGGAAEMNEGENIMYFSRKEQCLALGTQLRTKFKPRIEDFKIYRIYPRR